MFEKQKYMYDSQTIRRYWLIPAKMEYYKSQLKIDYDLNAILIPYAGECDLNFGLLDKL